MREEDKDYVSFFLKALLTGMRSVLKSVVKNAKEVTNYLALVAGYLCVSFLTNMGFLNQNLISTFFPDARPLRIQILVLAAVLGFGIGWLMSPQSRAFRRLAGIFFLTVITGAGIVDQGVTGITATLIAAIMLFSTGLGYGIRALARDFFSAQNYGSASWASETELEKQHVIGESGLQLGVFDGTTGPQPLHYTGKRHLLTVAPTRSGKGTCAIIPNLLTYSGSALVIDPKGENAMITAERRMSMGQKTFVLDPWGITGLPVARFNPMDFLKQGDIDITENAMLLADALVVSHGENDQFWIEEAKALLQGLILHVATAPEEEGQRHLGRVRDLMLLDGEAMPQLFQRMVQSEHHVVASTGARSLQKEEKLLSNILATAQAQTHLLDSPRMRESLSVSDFQFEDLKREKITVYLVLPTDRLNAFGRWLRLLIQ